MSFPCVVCGSEAVLFHLVYFISRIIELNGHKPPLTYKRFQAIISRMELPKKPVSTVISQQMETCKVDIQENHDDVYGVPSLEELGMCQERRQGLLLAQTGSSGTVCSGWHMFSPDMACL